MRCPRIWVIHVRAIFMVSIGATDTSHPIVLSSPPGCRTRAGGRNSCERQTPAQPAPSQTGTCNGTLYAGQAVSFLNGSLVARPVAVSAAWLGFEPVEDLSVAKALQWQLSERADLARGRAGSNTLSRRVAAWTPHLPRSSASSSI